MNTKADIATNFKDHEGMNCLARTILGLVFLVASWPKMSFPMEFLSDLYSYALVGPSAGLYLSATLPWMEFILGFPLVAGLVPKITLAMAAALFTAFIFVQARALVLGLEISCGCFGDGGTVNYTTLIRTALLLLFSAVTLFFYLRHEKGQRSSA